VVIADVNESDAERVASEISADGQTGLRIGSIPMTLDSGGGSIINITSLAALSGDVRNTAYGAAKAGSAGPRCACLPMSF